MSCEHNFVTRSGDAWLCHDCGIYFPKHPMEMDVKNPFDIELGATLKDFTDGMITLGEAASEMKVSMEEFAEAFNYLDRRVAIYDDMYELGKVGPTAKVFMGFEPERMSCPLEVDKFYGNMVGIEGIGSTFNDITSINHSRELESGFDRVIWEFSLDFVDGTTQKVTDGNRT